MPDSPVDRYELQARLIDKQHRIDGQGEITWTNRSNFPVTELYWHLYLNAFRGNNTYFFRSASGKARSGRRLATAGGIDLQQLRVTAPYDHDLLATLSRHSPQDPDDATDLNVPLPRPLYPGETLTLSMSFESQLPSIVERPGVSRDFTLAGQWFPKLARLEDGGRWAHFRFHPFAEFYADFATYDVTLDVPQALVVGATGRLIEQHVFEEKGNGLPTSTEAADDDSNTRQRLHYLAVNVHDFAWATWPHFQILQGTVGTTDVRILYPPGHERNAQTALRTVQQALPHFNLRYGKYPHPTLTIVHPPQHAGPAGGMEYPSFITTSGAWYSTYFTRAVEIVTIHELAHQWFQGTLATDERRYPFLDEGLGSYAESRESYAQHGQASALSLAGWEFSTLAAQRGLMLRAPHHTPLGSAAADFASFRQLGAIIYSRSVLLMQTLANVYGQHRLDTALASYAVSYAGHHPSLNDFLQALAPLGKQAISNLQGVLLYGHTVDYRVRELLTTTRPNNTFQNKARIDRQGDLIFPVDIMLETSNGEQHRRHWNGQGTSHTIEIRTSSPIVRVWIDPDAQILLDENLLNNAFASAPRPAFNFFERSLYALQLVLAWLVW